MSSLSTSFSLLTFSRSSNNKPSRKYFSRNPSPQISSKSKPKLNSNSKSTTSNDKPSSSSSSLSSVAVEATTYTRLPPKDDFLASSLIDAYREIKLSDSTVAPKFEEERAVNEEEFDRVGGNVGNLKGFNYEDYEVPDIEQDDEFDHEDEDEIDFEDDDVEMVLSGEEGEEYEDEKLKEKGVPAVMRCFDRAKIYVKAGNGGNGVVAFRREKFVPLGGPSGGDGGRGGNVYVEVDGAMNSLLPFRNCLHYRAGRGGHGHGRNQHGPKGEDVVVKVAPGTVIREARDDDGEGEVLLELLYPGQRALLLPGGRGGRGNAAFKSGVNKVPRIAENGEEGPEM